MMSLIGIDKPRGKLTHVAGDGDTQSKQIRLYYLNRRRPTRWPHSLVRNHCFCETYKNKGGAGTCLDEWIYLNPSTDTASLPYLTPGLGTVLRPTPHADLLAGHQMMERVGKMHGGSAWFHDSLEDVFRILSVSRLTNRADYQGPGCLDEIQRSHSGQIWSWEQ